MKLFKIQYYLFVSALLLIYGCKSKPEESNFSNKFHLSYQELAESFQNPTQETGVNCWW